VSKYRVMRGGSYDYAAWRSRATIRRRRGPERRNCHYGFRIVIRRKP
jgi:formylglycine-generating enzyme required for sulfatase activity